MSGHSQWNNIKFRKARQDAYKSKIFAKFSKEIYYLSKIDPNPDTNNSLKNTILQAKSQEVPNYIIEKAIKKACERNKIGQEVIYECMQSQNAFIIFALTDNKTRTSSEIKEILKKNNALISKCQYLFEKVYLIKILSTTIVNDEVLSLCKKIEKDQNFLYIFFEYCHASKNIFYNERYFDFSKSVIYSSRNSTTKCIWRNTVRRVRKIRRCI